MPSGLVLDGDIETYPQIDYTDSSLSDGISGGGEITGIGSQSEAQGIALVLQYGALPVSFRRLSMRPIVSGSG